MFVSVTIATHRRRDLLKDVLSAFHDQTASLLSFELIICDSVGSDDGTEELIQEYRRTTGLKIKYLQTQNILAVKRNDGIEQATSAFVIFLDDDCVPAPNFIAQYQKIAAAGSESNLAVYCGDVVFPPKLTKNSNFYRFRNERHSKLRNRKFGDAVPFYNIVVMNMGFFKKQFQDHVGGVSIDFVGYGCEDIDLGWRLHCKGFLFQASKALITHHEPSATLPEFLVKINRASRDGMQHLLKSTPDAVSHLPGFKLIEPNFPKERNWLTNFVYLIIKMMAFSSLYNLLVRFLESTDRFKLLYSPTLFKAAMAFEHLRGSANRNDGKRDLQKDWFE